MNKMQLTLATAMVAILGSTSVWADGNTVLAGAIGSALGAAIGHDVNGRNGAIVGAAIGGATGVAISSTDRSRQTVVRQAPPERVVVQPYPVQQERYTVVEQRYPVVQERVVYREAPVVREQVVYIRDNDDWRDRRGYRRDWDDRGWEHHHHHHDNW